MARLARDCKRTRPWKAEIKVNYETFFIGYFYCRDDAEQAERDLRLSLTGREDPMIGGPLRAI
jgi:hypothetical protein